MQKVRILIAQDTKVLKKTRDALKGHEIKVVADSAAARAAIAENVFDIFVLGIHFDESRAIDLVSFIRADDKHKTTPIFIVRLLPTSLGDSFRATTNALIKVGSITDYLELEGDPDFALKIKEAVASLLTANAPAR